MTLQNGLIFRGKAYLWTDTIACDATTGEPVGTISKVLVGTSWPWAAIRSGHLNLDDPHCVARQIGSRSPRNPSELIEACREALRAESDAGRIQRLLIAHPCRERGARLVMIANDQLPGLQSLEPMETVQYANSPADEVSNTAFAERDFSLDDMRQFIDRQVKTPALGYDGITPMRYGGHLIETRVTAKNVRARELRPI